MDVHEIPWVQILQVGGLAGITSALINGLVKDFFEWRERRRKAAYLALRLSLIFENYYHGCADRVYEIYNYRSSRGTIGDRYVGLPEIAEYPNDPASWVYLNQKVVDTILNFPAEISAINEAIKFNLDLTSGPDESLHDDDVTLEPLFEKAFEAISLARKIRRVHKLPKTLRTRDSEENLREKQQEFVRSLEAEANRRANVVLPSAGRQ